MFEKGASIPGHDLGRSRRCSKLLAMR